MGNACTGPKREKAGAGRMEAAQSLELDHPEYCQERDARDMQQAEAIKRAKVKAEMEAAHTGRREYLADSGDSSRGMGPRRPSAEGLALDSDLRDISTEHATEQQSPAVIYAQT